VRSLPTFFPEAGRLSGSGPPPTGFDDLPLCDTARQQKDISVSYFVNNLMGESIDSPDEARIRQILTELEKADDEHTDVSLGHESGWMLSVFRDKRLLWENVEDPDVSPREAALDSWDDVVDLLLELSRGNIEAVEAFGWDS
jgi:hypothetical protein